MRHITSPFKLRHYPPDLILLCVSWYCCYQLSYRDVEEMVKERGLAVDHSTIYKRLAGDDAHGPAKFVASLIQIAA